MFFFFSHLVLHFLKLDMFSWPSMDGMRESGLVFRTLLYWRYSHLNPQQYSEVPIKRLITLIQFHKYIKKTELNLLRFCFIMPSGQEACSNKMTFISLLSCFYISFCLSISLFSASHWCDHKLVSLIFLVF